jgi:acyl-CoA synthetase (AMP-forming)/AMP-acid ligase II
VAASDLRGEPVRAETLERFAAAFAPHGFDSRAFDLTYGMAETTLFAAGSGFGGLRTVTLDTDALEEDRVELVVAGGAGRRIVSAGRPGDGVTIRIVSLERREPLEDDRIGEIWVAGPSVAGGYWRRPEETQVTFEQRLAGRDGAFVRSGDLGFVHDGELYIVGRIEDLIIVRGRNHHAQDLELTAERSHPALRPGGGAAFSLTAGDERVVLVHEIRPKFAEEIAAISQAATRAIAREHAVTLHELVGIAPGGLPKTTSGKTMRQAMREDYLAGRLR